jgi:hypothetical protein
MAMALIALVAGCGGNGSSPSAVNQQSEAEDLRTSLYSAATIVVEAAYEPGAEPFTGSMSAGLQTWSIFEENIDALFSGRAVVPDSVVPSDLSEMKEIAAQNRTGWTASDILSLEEEVWNNGYSPGTVYVHVIFLHGYLLEDGTENRRILGASISGRPVMVVFKDVVLAAGFTSTLEKYMDQATLVHEFGHAAGLVDNGVPMVSGHEDPMHPKHCSSSLCVMYWLNEGATDLRNFASQVMGSGSVIMFCEDCLADTASYQP